MFFEIKMHRAMYVWCFYRLNCNKQGPANVFRGLEARRKLWFMFLKAAQQNQTYD